MNRILVLAVVCSGILFCQIVPIQGTDPISTSRITLNNNFNYLEGQKVPISRTITAGVGLTGGGDLSINRTISLAFPTASAIGGVISKICPGTDKFSGVGTDGVFICSADTGVGGSGHTIEDEGIVLTNRANLNFVGAGITCADSGGKTVCTVTSGGGGSWGSITGTLSSQTDLQSALDAKQALDADLTAIAALVCSDGQIMKKSSGVWGCAADSGTGAGVTSIEGFTDSGSQVWVASGTVFPELAGNNAFLGLNDFGAAFLEIPNGTTPPVSCTPGQIFQDTNATSGQQIYACEGSTFILQGGTGGPGGGTPNATNLVSSGTSVTVTHNASLASTRAFVVHCIDEDTNFPVAPLSFTSITANAVTVNFSGTVTNVRCTVNTNGSAGGVGSSAFDAITGGTNTSATMIVGSGASIATSGTGSVNATTFKGNATVATGDGGTGLTAAADDSVLVGNGTLWQSKAIPDCDAATTSKLLYDTATNTWSCGTDQNSGSGGAPTTATYITQTADAGLSAEQALSSLSTGLLTVTTGTGVLSSVGAPAGPVVGTTDVQSLSNKTLVTPTISSTGFTNAQHAHAGATSGGTIALSALTGTLSLTSQVAGILPIANGGTNLATATDDNVMVGNGTTWQTKAIPDCSNATTSKLLYNIATNTWTCGTDQGGSAAAFSAITTGTNTTAVMTVGSGASIATTGTGAVNATTFKGNATAAVADGGTNLTTSTDDNVMVGNGTTWQSKAIPDCDSSASAKLLYDAATNTWSCGTDQTVGSGASATMANIKTDYGAFGDGTTVDTTFVQNAASAGKSIWVPAGTYQINAEVGLADNTKFYCDTGATFRKVTGTGTTRMFLGFGDDDVSFENCRFDMNNVVLTADALIKIENGLRFTFKNNHVFNLAGNAANETHGLFIVDNSAHIEGNEFRDIKGFPIRLDSSQPAEIVQNRCYNSNSGCIYSFNNGGMKDMPHLVANNYAENILSWFGDGQVGNAFHVYQGRWVRFIGNKAKNTGYSCVRAASSDYITMDGNHCETIGETALYAEFTANYITITNNTVLNAQKTCISGVNLDVSLGAYYVISNNILQNCSLITWPGSGNYAEFHHGAIQVEGDATITGNLIDGSKYGMLLGFGSVGRGLNVTNNIIRDTRGSPAMVDGIAIRANASLSNITINHNDITGFSRKAINGHRVETDGVEQAIPAAVKIDQHTSTHAQITGALASAANGSRVYCTDCTIGSSCTSGGSGAFAQKTAGAWSCGATGGAGAPTDATYITQTANASLSAEQALSSLATGFVRVTTGTGVLTSLAALTDADVPDTITAINYLPLAGGTLTAQLVTDNLGIEFAESDTNPTCTTGNYNIFADTSESKLKKCTNGTITDLDTGGAGAATAITSSATLPPTCTAGDVYFDTDATSGVRAYVCDSADTWRYFITGTTSGTGVITMLEGSAPGAGANAGEHNLYIDSADSKLKSHENGGSIVTYPTSPIAVKVWLAAAGCANGIGALMWNYGATAPTANCSNGTTETSMIRATADFPDTDGNFSLQQTFMLPSDWTGAVDVLIKYRTAATSGNTVWQVLTACRANGEVDDVLFNTASTVTDAAQGTANFLNDAPITGITTTGCAAGELMHLRLLRQRTHASDTMTGVVSFVGIEVTMRRSI